MLNLILAIKFESSDELMLYYWLDADVSQCGVIIVCMCNAGELMPYTTVTRPIRNPTHFLSGDDWGSMHVTANIKTGPQRQEWEMGPIISDIVFPTLLPCDWQLDTDFSLSLHLWHA